jgi:predicted RNA-binding Zn ribbon-like protein
VPVPLLNHGRALDLLNTVWADRSGVHDALGDTALAGDWAGSVLTDAGAVTLRGLRDALRILAAERTGDPRPVATGHQERVVAAVAAVNAVSALAPRWPVLADGNLEFASQASGEDRLLGELAGEGVRFFADEPELRACLAPGCVLYFVKDHPRREWCSTACGNRARAARHYARHRR